MTFPTHDMPDVWLTEAPEGPHLIVILERSEGMQELMLKEGWPKDAIDFQSTFYMRLTEGPWLQFTYDELRSQDGEFASVNFDWNAQRWVGPDGKPASDLIISFGGS